MPILPLLLALLAIIHSIDAGLIGSPAHARIARQEDAAATAAAESAAANEGLSLLQIFQDHSMSRAGIKQRVSSWASDNQFADLVAEFENSVRQRTLARREQAKEAAVELPKALDTIADIEDDMLLTPSETYSKVDQTLKEFSPKLRSLVLTAMEPTPLSDSATEQRDDVTESSGDLPVEVDGSGVNVEIVEGSGEGSGADDYDEGSGTEVEGSGEARHLEIRSLIRSPMEGSGIEGSGQEQGSGVIEGSGAGTFPTNLPPIQVVIDVYDDTTSTPAPSASYMVQMSAY